MTTLYLIRHGETVENIQHLLQGHLPGRLTKNGMAQAEALRCSLTTIHFDTLLCSDLQRCIHTARILNAGRQLPLITTTLLRERDWGSFTGKPIAEVRNLDFPSDVESVDAMRERARQFLEMVYTHYPEQQVMAVGHGLMNRAIQAVYHQKEIREIEPMANATFRILHLPHP